MNRSLPISATLLGSFLLFSNVVAAGNNFNNFTIVPSACVVDEADTTLYSFNSPKLMFAAGKTGTIGVRCMVTNPVDSGLLFGPSAPNPTWHAITIGCNDPDGSSGLDYEVHASLARVRISNGVSSTITQIDCNTNTKSFSHTFDFWNYAYWIGINIQRKNTAQNPSAWAVRLW
jgi:hypothetical protein